MILVDWQIRVKINEGLTDPQWIPLVNTTSMDVTIGSKCLLLRPNDYDFESKFISDNIGNKFEKWDIMTLSEFMPNQRILVEIEQEFNFPATISGQFHLKSSRAREFYDHKLAGWIDAGFRGKLTLELINHSYNPLPLYQGLRIGQITFYEHEYPNDSYDGKYQGDATVSISKDAI